MNWHIWKCSGIVCSCSTERGIRERENEMSGIVIEKVRKSFDTKDGVVEALKDVNLNIDSGDIYGIIGMSGAGKSTLVRCMNFLEVPTEGQVLIDGKALGDLTEKELRKQREEIGMIFQHFNLLMQKSVIDNVCFPLYIKGKLCRISILSVPQTNDLQKLCCPLSGLCLLLSFYIKGKTDIIDH